MEANQQQHPLSSLGLSRKPCTRQCNFPKLTSSKVGLASSRVKLCMMRSSVILASWIEKRMPTQMRGPSPKGRYAWLCSGRLALSGWPSSQRSGRKTSASGHSDGLWCML